MSNGKGDRPRPMTVPKTVFDTEYERIFPADRPVVPTEYVPDLTPVPEGDDG